MPGPLLRLRDIAEIAWVNRGWMSWNLFLATVPLVLAVALFHRPRRKGLLWWLGVAVFVLFLPNAPYVLTDLLHLDWNLDRVDYRSTALLGVLPIFGVFVLAGLSAYAGSLAEVRRLLRRDGRERWIPAVMALLHVLCAVGVVLGRVYRLNSWNAASNPMATTWFSAHALTRPRPLAVMAVLAVAFWLVDVVLRTVGAAAWQVWRRRIPGRRRAAPAA